MIFIPCGSNMPFAIREIGKQAGHYQLIGPCYIHSMMHGEVFQFEKEGKFRSKDVFLF